MEVAIIDCYHSEALLSKSMSSHQLIIFFLQRGTSLPQEPTTALLSNNLLYGMAPGRYHLVVESEVDLGYRLCQCCSISRSVTVYTTATELYSPLGVNIASEAVTERPREVVNLAKEARNAVLITIKKESMQKYLFQLRMPASQRPMKTERAKNVLKGLVSGIYISKRLPLDGIEGPDKLTDDLFQKMHDLGIVTMTGGGTIQYNDDNIHRLFNDPKFMDRLLMEDGANPVPQPVPNPPRSQYSSNSQFTPMSLPPQIPPAPQFLPMSLPPQSSEIPQTFETTTESSASCPSSEEALCNVALQVCDDLNQYTNMQVTIGWLLDDVYWRMNCAWGGTEATWVSRVLGIMLDFGVFRLPPTIQSPRFLSYPENYREFPLIQSYSNL